MTAAFALGARGSNKLARRDSVLVLIREDCKKGGVSSTPATETRTVEQNGLKTVAPEAAPSARQIGLHPSQTPPIAMRGVGGQRRT